jgi:hypothetical protein
MLKPMGEWLAIKIVAWLVHAAVVMLSVAFVSPGNPRNTLARALVVTAVVAVFVTPFAAFWWLLIPGLVALFAWWVVYGFAYGIGLFRSLFAGIVQSVLMLVLDWLLRGPHGRSAPPPPLI